MNRILLATLAALTLTSSSIWAATTTTAGSKETFNGVGTFETVCFGRHPSGFKDILDGAA